MVFRDVQLDAGYHLQQWEHQREAGHYDGSAPLLHVLPHGNVRVGTVGRGHSGAGARGEPELDVAGLAAYSGPHGQTG